MRKRGTSVVSGLAREISAAAFRDCGSLFEYHLRIAFRD
jgi:hypothetical protein